jgi:hypothetical protein
MENQKCDQARAPVLRAAVAAAVTPHARTLALALTALLDA